MRLGLRRLDLVNLNGLQLRLFSSIAELLRRRIRCLNHDHSAVLLHIGARVGIDPLLLAHIDAFPQAVSVVPTRIAIVYAFVQDQVSPCLLQIYFRHFLLLLLSVLFVQLFRFFRRLFGLFLIFGRSWLVGFAVELGSLQDVVAILDVIIDVVTVLLEMYLRCRHVGLRHPYEVRVVL